MILVAYGLGLPNGAATSLTEGSATQSGSLPFTPQCSISSLLANVAAALISPGLYQLNVTVRRHRLPDSLETGAATVATDL